MSKYSSSARRTPSAPRNRIPAAVRGIGCLLMVIVPIFSWFLGAGLVNKFGGVLPPNWMGYPKIPPLLFRLQGIYGILNFIGNQQALTAKIIFALAIIVIIGSITSIAYGYIYRMFGPSQYGPQDVPPPNVRTKKYKR